MTDSPLVIVDPDLRQLHQFWESKRGARLAPARAEVDPLSLRFVLGNVLLVDVLREPLLFRYRLVGTNLVTRVGFDPTGQFVHDHPEPVFRQFALEVYRQVAETATPYADRREQAFDDRTRRYEVLLLPLSSDGSTVDMVLGGMKFLD